MKAKSRKDVTMIWKIRAWDEEKKTMYNVRQIDFRGGEFRSSENEWMKFDNVIFMRSTGLKDKNGAEIYEGDIVKPVSFASWIGVVKYSSENAAYILDDHNNEFIRGENVYLSQFNEGLEVLGNIYENPELM